MTNDELHNPDATAAVKARERRRVGVWHYFPVPQHRVLHSMPAGKWCLTPSLSPRASGRLAEKSGFTIVEILTVIGIIVLFLGISVPVVTTVISRRGLQGGALTAQLALQQARNAAIMQRAFVSITFEFVKGKGDTLDHYRIRITGSGRAIYHDLPGSVTIGGEAVEVKNDDIVLQAFLKMPAHSYPIIFSPDGSLVPQITRQGETVNLWDPVDGGRVVILRDSASEPFTDQAKSYFGNSGSFKNGVFDRFSPSDEFLKNVTDPKERKRVDPNMNGMPDSQIYLMVEPYTGRTYMSEDFPDAWYY